ncbi:MAG TPA: VOC family protein [Steroidobacteraceae bacterium]|jgi:predicted lactoylglutathione lyase
MHSQMFVNLPVKDLKRSVDFFTKVGYSFNPQFTDDNATCMIVGENLFVMLLTEPFFRGFTNKAITDTTQATETLTCLACNSKEQVDELVAKARAAGAKVPRTAQDHGFMYAHGYEDIDGHTWELVHMRGMPPQ